MDWIFYILATIAIAGALGVLLFKNIMHSAFSLMLCLIILAALYVYAQAEFLGATQLLVYVGGIVVLLIFGIMLSQVKKTQEQFSRRSLGVLIAGGFIYIFSRLIYSIVWPARKPYVPSENQVYDLGIGFFTDNLLAFELAGILLLVALISAMIISDRQEKV